MKITSIVPLLPMSQLVSVVAASVLETKSAISKCSEASDLLRLRCLIKAIVRRSSTTGLSSQDGLAQNKCVFTLA